MSWRFSAALGTFLALVSVVAPARATLVLTLDNPNQTVNAPTSGTTDLLFTGTVQPDPGNSVDSLSLGFAFNSTRTLALFGTIDNGAFGATNASPYVGLLFTVHVPAGTPPGLYSLNFPGNASFSVEENDGNGHVSSVSVDYSVDVLAPVSTPEPSTFVMLISGGVGLAVFSRRSRRQARNNLAT